MKFALAVAIAMSFWGDRGVTVPCQPVPVAGADAQLPMDAYGSHSAMAATSGCRVLISHEAAYLRVDDPARYCAMVTHEIGHLAGLPHSPTGLMAETLDWENIPYACTRWKQTAARLGWKVVPVKAPKPRDPCPQIPQSVGSCPEGTAIR